MFERRVVGRGRKVVLEVFSGLDRWFDREADLRSYRPSHGGWSIDMVLEHLGLVNRRFAATLGEWVELVVSHAHRGVLPLPEQQESPDLGALLDARVGGLFGGDDGGVCLRMDHVEPAGAFAPEEVRGLLREQLDACLAELGRLEGSKRRVRADGMRRWLKGLDDHTARHVRQMEAIADEYHAYFGEPRLAPPRPAAGVPVPAHGVAMPEAGPAERRSSRSSGPAAN